MQLQSICIKNFRRLRDVKIDLEKETSIFVGANNSGKTSATHALQAFLAGKADFTIYDFSAGCWKQFNELDNFDEGATEHELPTITLDLWFKVDVNDITHVIDLLPNLEWEGSLVGVRLEYAPKQLDILIGNYKKAKTEAQKKNQSGYKAWPACLTDYLTRRLKNEYEIKYFVLDYSKFDAEYNQSEDYIPLKLGDENERPGAKIIRSLIKVDFLFAQRHLSDSNISSRSEDLSKRLNRFYERNLEKRDEDAEAMKALVDSEVQLTNHLAIVFKPTLQKLNKLGYPGFSNPKLVIKAAFNYESVSQSAKLHYALGSLELPDRYNGLGFKNLIYMVLELLDFHERWIEDLDNRAPLHLILIEEPEAHLHAQLQQVFISQIWDILNKVEKIEEKYSTQLLITTHSPHIIYESGFQPIRYFHRCIDDENTPTSNVLNLSIFYNGEKNPSREFLQKYMKLTHCDLFFADAAILVEGNVERLLLPLMIDKCAKKLQSTYLTTIEVGGAFAYEFRNLIEFLGLTTLIITDLDSVTQKPQVAIEEDEAEQDEEGNLEGAASKGACMTNEEGAETSNLTLQRWLPKLTSIKELIEASDQQRTQIKSDTCPATVSISYQTPSKIVWKKEEANITGRTLEEAFALENLEWCQKEENKKIGLRVVIKKRELSLSEIHTKLFKRIKSSGFKKTDFALGILMSNQQEWNVPNYISKGLIWLTEQISKRDEEDLQNLPEAIIPEEEPAKAAEIEETNATVQDKVSKSAQSRNIK